MPNNSLINKIIYLIGLVVVTLVTYASGKFFMNKLAAAITGNESSDDEYEVEDDE